MNIQSFIFNPFYENTYVISVSNGDALVIDPGCYEVYEKEELFSFLDKEKLNVKAVINTHCHIDHVLGNKAVAGKYNAPLKIPKHEEDIYQAVVAYGMQWGITEYQHYPQDEMLGEGNQLQLGDLIFEVIEVPGHSPGHLMFYEKKEKVLIGGDVLFKESIGRTDLPGGNHEQLLSNIKEKVYTLPDDVTVYPGHGPTTTIGHEKQYNPFVKG